ncbi:MAG: DNA-binding IclR family transcriptional regulator [Candidatus Aldehydirespiratoraceae bacterium]|jgi:DNA-binding IclR family transcriptional regulator
MEPVQSVERAMAILREVGREPGGLVDLAERVALPTSTAARLLSTLESEGVVRRNGDGAYGVGPMIQSLSAAVDPSQQVRTIVFPHLEELSTELDEAVCFSVLSGPEIVTVDQVDAPKPVQAENWTGTRVPLHAGGAGLVAMATWPDADVVDYLASDLAMCSESTIVDPEQLHARVRRARSTRVMWTHGEYVDGLSSCSAAVIGPNGQAIGSLYTYGPSYRFPPRGTAADVAALVLVHADEINRHLGSMDAIARVSAAS